MNIANTIMYSYHDVLTYLKHEFNLTKDVLYLQSDLSVMLILIRLGKYDTILVVNDLFELNRNDYQHVCCVPSR